MITLAIGQPGSFALHGGLQSIPDLAEILIAHGFTAAAAAPDLLLLADLDLDLDLDSCAEILDGNQARLAILLIPPATNQADWRESAAIAAAHAFVRASALSHAPRDLRVNAITFTPPIPALELAQTIALMLGLPSMTGQILTLAPAGRR